MLGGPRWMPAGAAAVDPAMAATKACRLGRSHQSRGALLVVVIFALGMVAPLTAAARPKPGPPVPAYTEQAELLPSGQIGNASPGISVALSGDGTTALLGGPADNEGQGAVWAFRRHGATWIQEAKLTGLDEVGKGRFGESVALSDDGRTALIGGPQDNSGIGAVWSFTRSRSGWRQRGLKLTVEGEIGEGAFGKSVALSSNAKVAFIGAPNDNHFTGAAWAFVRRGSVWVRQGEKLTGGGEEVGEALFGDSVALSARGRTALVGGPQDDWVGGHGCARRFTCAGGPTGAAWVFERSHSHWTQQGAKLTVAQASFFGSYFGESVALSGDGDTALIGGPSDDWPEENEGAVLVFARSGPAWAQQGESLKNSDPATDPFPGFGSSVALADDGDTALIGGAVPEAWVFSRSGATWSQRAPTLLASGGTALSADGSTALVGRTIFAR